MNTHVPVFKLLTLLLAVLALMISVALAICTALPETSTARLLARGLPAAETHARAAEAAFARRDWALSARETHAELAVSPVHEDAWLRVARINLARTGGLGIEGEAALERTYDARPYDTSLTGARRCLAKPLRPEVSVVLAEAIDMEDRGIPERFKKTC